MSSTKFIAILPQHIQRGDRIQISGRVSDHAEKFSINFANEVNENPQSIIYYFNWDLAHKMLIEGFKGDDEWKNRKETKFDTLDGSEFALDFSFQDDGIYVYFVYEYGRNLLTYYQPVIDLQFVESVQVCGDVEKVTQLTFSYN